MIYETWKKKVTIKHFQSKIKRQRERESEKKRNNGRKFMVISKHDIKTFARV
jgi:hypothetical protein